MDKALLLGVPRLAGDGFMVGIYHARLVVIHWLCADSSFLHMAFRNQEYSELAAMNPPMTALLKRLQDNGPRGITYDAKDASLVSILPLVKELRQHGHNIKQEILSPSKMNGFGKRVKFVLEGWI